MSKILYIHGFGSCGVGNKSTALRHYFGSKNVLSPDLPVSPLLAISLLEVMIREQDVGLLIGSSLGGYYATYLAEKYRIKAVLLNPSTVPYRTLQSYVGIQERFCDKKPFLFKQSYMDDLYTLQMRPMEGRYLVLLQSEDEVIDYTKAQTFYNKYRVIVEYGGNHRFENIGDYLCMIDRFYKH
ncbi:MAG: hypothetical protein DSZ10_05475 [Sulfurovum sp.]|nr:MAG: hypothetical protein DSZ10_05475 [Sulfurovum sp.]